jgi:uncharacterized membrane protein HdeD (DUF308 family)
METKQRPWWLSLLAGIVAVLVGAVLLWSPAKTKADAWTVLIAILGLYWLVTGFLEIIGLFSDRTAWGWKLFIGIISIAAGAYILMYPIASALVLPRIFVLVLGLWGLLQGIIMLIMAFRGGGWAAGILGALAIIFGAALVANYSLPGVGVATVWTVGVVALFGGIILIVQAFRTRSS